MLESYSAGIGKNRLLASIPEELSPASSGCTTENFRPRGPSLRRTTSRFVLSREESAAHLALDRRGEPKVRNSKSCQKCFEIDQSGKMCIGQDAQCSRYLKTPPFCLRTGRSVIDENIVGLQQFCQGQRSPLAGIQETERRIRHWVPLHLKPDGWLCNEDADWQGRAGLPKFLHNDLGYEDAIIKRFQHFQCFDQN